MGFRLGLALIVLAGCASEVRDNPDDGRSETFVVETEIEARILPLAYPGTVTFSLTCNSPACTFSCELNGQTYPCAASTTVAAADAGDYRFAARAVVFGKADRSPAVVAWKVYEPVADIKMVTVPEGCFLMGKSVADSDYSPAHEVCLAEFQIDVHEATNESYKACEVAGVCRPPRKDISEQNRTDGFYSNPKFSNYPVIFLTWFQAKSYCEWMGKRLPTEAEWERAARGGLAQAEYPLGNLITCTDANYGNYVCDTHPDVREVAGFQANGYGAYDMVGNVWEWVADWYDHLYYDTAAASEFNPAGPEFGLWRVMRGGSYDSPKPFISVYYRHTGTPGDSLRDMGVRCAMTP